jgi:membrane-bound serine protease (ClpP class)
MLRLAPIRSAAPGGVVGYRTPLVTGTELAAPDGPANTDQVVVEVPLPGLVDVVEPALSNLLAALDGTEVSFRGQTTTLATLGPATGPDGEPLLDEDGSPAETVVAEVRFHQPGPLESVMRAALAPEVAFFLVIAGLAVAAFEFYAAGPGVAAAVAALCLLVGGYGMVTLPTRWWAVVLLLGGIGLLTAEFQVGRFGRWSLLGGVMILAGGMLLTDAEPHLAPSWWGVTLATLGVVLFYFAALPTVARARFSTQTVGRDHLIGREGVATTRLGPDGEVEVDGARWSATAHRAADITAGDPVTVTAVQGTVLEVEPSDADRSPT